MRTFVEWNPNINELGAVGTVGQAPVWGRRLPGEYLFTGHESSILHSYFPAALDVVL